MRFSSRGAVHKWLSYKNVFVAFISKADNETPAANLFNELVVSLQQSSPPLLRMLLTHAKTKLEQGGFSYEEEMLNSPDPLVHAAWLYQLIDSERGGDIQLEELLARMFDSLQPDLIRAVIGKTTDLITESLGTSEQNKVRETEFKHQREPTLALQETHCQSALTLAGIEGATTEDILHALNSFLSLEQIGAKKLTAGTVFALAAEASAPEICWVCVTAACDMEPRAPSDKNSWHREIYPTKSVLTLKLHKTKIQEALRQATHYRALFIPLRDKQRFAFRIMDEEIRQPRTQVFFVADNAKLDENGDFLAYLIRKSSAEANAVELHPDKYKVIAQLRGPYADRLLQETGHHSSRIGVDFVNLLSDESLRSKKSGATRTELALSHAGSGDDLKEGLIYEDGQIHLTEPPKIVGSSAPAASACTSEVNKAASPEPPESVSQKN